MSGRFKNLIDKSGDCWVWLGCMYADGYGRYVGTTAHRAVYLEYVGPIPAGLELDHLCLNTRCVNPAHLEPVTRAENMRRRNALVTECHRGHPFDAANTYVSVNSKGQESRSCRTCQRATVARYQARKRAKAASPTP